MIIYSKIDLERTKSPLKLRKNRGEHETPHHYHYFASL